MSSLTVQLEEPTELELSRRAAARGMPLEEFARTILEREIRLPMTPNQRDPEAWATAIREWAESHPKREGIVIDDDRGSMNDRDGAW